MTMPSTADPFQETSEPQFGATPPPLAGKELPSFRYALGAMATKTFDGVPRRKPTSKVSLSLTNSPAFT